jgi:hypothetical protein
VFAIQPGARHQSDEELAAISVRACISHGQLACSGVLDGEVFIIEFVAIDALPTCAIEVGEVTPLDHELRDDAVEETVFVVQTISLFTCA